ncbi:MAG: hypothetical protein AB8B54_06780 [Sphingorhabdus sp.]
MKISKIGIILASAMFIAGISDQSSASSGDQNGRDSDKDAMAVSANPCGDESLNVCFLKGQNYRKAAQDGLAEIEGESPAVIAYKRFRHVCEQGGAEGCVYAVDTARNLLKSNPHMIEIFKLGCGQGQSKYCGAGFFATSNSSVPEYSLTQAMTFANKGCGLEDALMCKKVEELKANPALDAANASSYIEQ